MKLADFAWLFSGVVLNTGAQMALKTATRVTGPIGAVGASWSVAATSLTQAPYFWLALCAYGLSVLVWVIGLSRMPVSQAYPILSLGYVLTAALAWPLLGETVSLQRFVGILVIVLGVWIVVRT